MKAWWPPIYITVGSRTEIPKSPQFVKFCKNSQGEISSYKESSPAWYGTVHQNEFDDQQKAPLCC